MNIGKVSNHMLRLFRRRFTSIYHVRQLYYRIKYPDSYPKAYKILYVDPSRINHLIIPRFEKVLSPFGTHIIGGDWDQRRDREITLTSSYTRDPVDKDADPFVTHFDNYVFFQSVKAHFEDEIPWKETRFYKQAMELVRGPESVSRHHYYGTPEKIQKRLGLLDNLYEDIRENGYFTQRELMSRPNSPFRPRSNPRPEHHEVTVDIDRNGSFILEEGRHRVTLAKIIGIDSIPVRVLVRHSKWQNIRSDMAETKVHKQMEEYPASFVDHPDIKRIAR